MLNRKPPAFQFYAKDFLTGTMDMSLVEIGAYTKLLAWSWDSGPVPASEDKRAKILGVSLTAMRRVWDAISYKWVETDEGFINERLEVQRQSLLRFLAQQSDRGSAGAEKRWRKHGARKAKAIAQAQPDDSSAVCDLQSSELPQGKEHPSEVDPPVAPFESFWRLYPRKTGKGAAEDAWRKLKPSTKTLEEIRSALAWQCNQPQWTREGGKFIPHPATWLNQRRWQDEPFSLADETEAAWDSIGARLSERGGLS